MIRQILLDVEEQRVKAELEQIRKEEIERKEEELKQTSINRKRDDINHSDIKFKDTSTSSSITHNLLLNIKGKYCNLCGVCNNKESFYKCPRCKILYCGLECYKTHSEKCTEEFYKDCVMKELKATKASRESQSSMNKILQESKETKDGDPIFYSKKQQDRFNEILNKIENLSLNDLTQQEKNDFDSYIKTVKNFDAKIEIREWIPWWRDYEEEDKEGFIKNFSKLIIEEVNDDHEEQSIQVLLNNNLNHYVIYDKQDDEEDDNEESLNSKEKIDDPISEAFNVLIDELDEAEENEEKFRYKDKYTIVKERYK